MAKLYLYHAVDIVNQKGKEGIVSFAEGDEQRMMLMGLKRFTKYTNMPNVIGLREKIAAKIISENKYAFYYFFLILSIHFFGIYLNLNSQFKRSGFFNFPNNFYFIFHSQKPFLTR